MKLKLFVLLLMTAGSLSLHAQKYRKSLSKIKLNYEKGIYLKSLPSAEKLARSLEKSRVQHPDELAEAYLYVAKSQEVLNKYKLYESSIVKYLQIAEKNAATAPEKYHQALLNVAEIYIDYGDGNKADSLIQLTSSRFLSSENSNSSRNRLKSKYLKARVDFINGYYIEASDSIIKYLPKIQEEANTALRNLKEQIGKSGAKQELNERKLGYGNWLNLLTRIYVERGDLEKADSCINVNKIWLARNVEKTDLPFYENLYLSGLRNIYNENKKQTIGNLETSLKLARKGHYKVHRLTLDIHEDLLYTYQNYEYKKSFRKKGKDFRKVIAKTYSKKSANYLRWLILVNRKEIADEKVSSSEKRYVKFLSSPDLPYLHPLRIELLKEQQNAFLISNHYAEAQKNLEEINRIRKKLNGNNAPVFHLSNAIYANFIIEYGQDYKVAGEIFQKSFKMVLERELHPFHKDYLSILNSMSSYYDLTDQLGEATNVLEKSVSITYKKFKKENLNHALQLEKLASIQIRTGEYDKANENIFKSISLFDRYNSDRSYKEYAKALATYSRLLMQKGMYEEARDNFRKSAKFLTRSQVGDFKVINVNNEDVAQMYLQQGKYVETEKMLTKSLSDKEALFGKNHRMIIPTLNQLANLRITKGDYSEADKTIERSKQLTIQTFGETSSHMNPVFLAESDIYFALGDFEKAGKMLDKAIQNTIKRVGENQVEVATQLSKKASVALHSNSDLNSIERDLVKARDIFKQKLGTQNLSYAQSLVDIAKVKIRQKKYGDAIFNLTEANKIFVEDLGRENTLSSAGIFIALGDVYLKQKGYDKAKDFYNRAKKIYDKILNDKHPDYVKILSKQARMYYELGDFEQSRRNMDQVLENYVNYTNVYFSSLSERAKTKFWNLIKPDFEFYNSLALAMQKKNPEITQSVYNNALLTKSLLLNTSMKIKERILRSDDENLKDKYYNWIDKKEVLATISAYSQEELRRDSLDPKKLSQEIEILEKELSAKSEFFKSGNEQVKIDWKNIASSLKLGEVAIEMIRFRVFKESFEDSVIYAALIVKPGMINPEMVIYKNGLDLEQKYLKVYRNSIKFKLEDNESYGWYWSPIKDKIGKASKIYFSPEGVFNQINIEALSKEDGTYVLDEDNLVLVNNTKDIYLAKIAQKETNESKSVSIFGNPEFYSKNDANKSLSQLPGTEEESRELDKLLAGKGWESKSYISQEASEENIKLLTSPRIFHIATHGFFMADQESESGTDENQVLQNPLFRSGLMLKGAGDIIKDSYSVSSINRESGILTAYEAMNLNFDNTDLVVLSACETGLGEVTVGEGVYGLQRAFLVAGAKSIIMSLFKVSDEATQKLMLSFYRNWLETGNKRESFVMAKKELRKEYAEPIYWGSFVMVGME